MTNENCMTIRHSISFNINSEKSDRRLFGLWTLLKDNIYYCECEEENQKVNSDDVIEMLSQNSIAFLILKAIIEFNYYAGKKTTIFQLRNSDTRHLNVIKNIMKEPKAKIIKCPDSNYIAVITEVNNCNELYFLKLDYC